MVNNVLRHGNATSSEIVALTKMGSRDMTDEELEQHKKNNPKSRVKKIESWPGEAANTYIREMNMERKGQRSLETEVDARPMSWGKMVEYLVFLLLGMEYILSSTETLLHPIIRWWAGSPDGSKENTVMDIKSPWTLKSFFALVDPLYNGFLGVDAMNALRNGWTDKLGIYHKPHPDAEKYYWQLVSNSILLNKKYAQLIVYMPYFSELEAIKAEAMKPENASRFAWIAMQQDGQLPYIQDGGYYQNINVIEFEVPEADKILLTKRVLQAGVMLYENKDLAVMYNHWEECTGSASFEISVDTVGDDNFVKSVYTNDLQYEQLFELSEV